MKIEGGKRKKNVLHTVKGRGARGGFKGGRNSIVWK